MTRASSHGLAERIRRWHDFFDRGKPPSHLFRINYAPDALPFPKAWPDRREERIEWAKAQYGKDVARMEWLRDDSIPCLYPFTGTEIFAEAFGCRVARPDDNMPFALPLISKPSEVARLRTPRFDAPPLGMLFEIADALRAWAGRDAVMRVVDIQSPMDIASLIWDKNTFFMAMIEEPQAVKDLAAMVRELLTAFLDEWFARYGTEFVAHYPAYYMPGGITLSEDDIGTVGVDAFEEFYLPELVELSRRYGAIGIHCCAHARHQWDGLMKTPNLRLLNLNQPVEVIREAYSRFASHCAQMHLWYGEGDPWTWPAQLPANSRVVIEAGADSRERAIEISEKLRAACGRK
ncbi:MAG TPA: uroporphyrinogen decarboxylase family protein [Candidatus Brocadiia bacterium]|nr:uroporphyrinogen decarboxylase family protein [Candidatus Brocadiia bacterium]